MCKQIIICIRLEYLIYNCVKTNNYMQMKKEQLKKYAMEHWKYSLC